MATPALADQRANFLPPDDAALAIITHTLNTRFQKDVQSAEALEQLDELHRRLGKGPHKSHHLNLHTWTLENSTTAAWVRLSIHEPPFISGVHLDFALDRCHIAAMSKLATLMDIDDRDAEKAALEAAVAKADADLRVVPHEEMRVWLLRIAAGEFDAPAPEPRFL